jgi:Gene product 88
MDMRGEGKAFQHSRKAEKAHGDDTTLSRFVKMEGHVKRPNRQPRLPGMEAAFIQEGRTRFTKSVKPVSAMRRLLVSGHSNIKIGRDVRKGKFRGYWIYTLSLEERKTCPASCNHWQTCYGNNMPFAKRIDHTDPDFLPRLQNEIALLCKQHPAGVLIRLHALGDFYSQEYVYFWHRMLAFHPNLAVFGYTARLPGQFNFIGNSIQHMNMDYPGRCMIRVSNGPAPTMSTLSIRDADSAHDGAFICPEQSGKTQCCATCGACWSTTKNVAFMEH